MVAARLHLDNIVWALTTEINARKLYSYCRPIQLMHIHTSLELSLHGVVVFFVIIEYECNNVENSKLQ